MSSRSPRLAIAVASFALVLTGCFTGERPSFEDEQDGAAVSTGSAEIDGVLDLLDSADDAQFTAEYEIVTKFGALDSTATVSHDDAGRLSVVVERSSATTRYLAADGNETTCNVVTSECESQLNDARMSDVGIPHTFYAPSFATRLRVSADRRIGDTVGYEETIAGQPATCVDVTVAGGTETFCALASGPLGRFVGNDVTVTLTDFQPSAEPSAFDAA